MKITLFSILTLMFMTRAFVPNSFAQDYAQWNLPENVKVRFGKGGINEIAYSPDGSQLAVASHIGTWIYDTRTGAEVALLTGHTNKVLGVSFSPDGLTLASGSLDGTIHLWEVATGVLLRTFTGLPRGVLSVSFSPDGQTLAGGSWGRIIRLWEVATGKSLHTLVGHTGFVLSVSFSPDGQTLASGSEDRTVRLWEVATGKPLHTLEGHTRSVWSVSFSPDGLTLASGSWDGTIRLWEVATGTYLRRLKSHTDGVYSVSFSPDGQMLASSGVDGTVRLWEVNTGEHLHTFEGHVRRVLSVSFSPDGRALASGSWDGTVHLWEVATGVPLRTIVGHEYSVRGVSFSPDGEILARAGDDGTVRLWEVGTDKPLHTLGGHIYGVSSISFSPDGQTLASGSGNGTIHLWEVATGVPLRTFKGHTRSVWSVSFSPNGLTLASASADGTTRLWEVATGTRLRMFEGHTDFVRSVSFSPDGRTLASGSDDETVRLWEVATGKPLRTIAARKEEVNCVSFSPDGRTLASADSYGTVRLWEVATGAHLRTFIGHLDKVLSTSFTPDGRTLASASWDGTIRLWEVATGQSLYTLEGHTNFVLSLSFSPDAATLASASSDGTVLLWDVTPFIPEQTPQDTDIQETQLDTAGIQRYEREMVRLIYFRPSDRSHRQSINTELDTLIRWSQYFFAEQMQDYGDRKTFAFETDPNGYARVHHLTGKFTDTYYHHDTYDKVLKEVAEQFDSSRHVYLIAVDVSSEFIDQEGTCGIGGGGWNSFDNELWRRDFGGAAVIPASGVCVNPSVTAHELGHVFGLDHDFRSDTYLMAYGTQKRLSPCAAEWLDTHRFFNNDPTFFDETTTMDMLSSLTSGPDTRRFRFELTDADGLHQVQLIVPAAATDPAPGTKLHSCKSLSGENQTVEFTVTELTATSGVEVTLQVIDIQGNITKQTFPVLAENPVSNRAPVAIGTIPDQTLTLGGGSTTLSISSYFSDPDGDVLSYKAETNNTRVVAVSLAGTQITITPRGIGSASVAVTASDGKLLVTQRISVQVRSAPIADATDNFDDPFEGTALQNPNWQWQNEPANWDVGETRENFLHIEGETNRNLWASDATHFLYQETDADTFDVETHFFARWDTSSGINGLVVKSPADNNWVTLKFWSRDAAAKGQIQYQTKQNENGNGLTSNAGFTPTFGSTELFFRLRKQGNTYTGWYKTGEADPWIEIGVTNFVLTPPLQLGISAGVAAGTGTLTVDYAYFRSTVDTDVLASPVLHFAAMEAPRETTLLPNYPNPFNPETWIPYQLSSPSDVTVRIYALNGSLVRRLSLGHQDAGMYRGRSRAAYWDGKNEIGEPVASGMYFYTLTADDFTATRKMLIRK